MWQNLVTFGIACLCVGLLLSQAANSERSCQRRLNAQIDKEIQSSLDRTDEHLTNSRAIMRNVNKQLDALEAGR